MISDVVLGVSGIIWLIYSGVPSEVRENVQGRCLLLGIGLKRGKMSSGCLS